MKKLYVCPILPNNNKGSLLIDVTHDDPDYKAKPGDEDIPQVHFLESFPVGSSFEVPDDVCHAIMHKYKAYVSDKPWPTKNEPMKNKMAEGASRTA